MRQLYHRLAHLFDPDLDYHSTVAIDETKLRVKETEVYVRAADNVETFELIHIEVSPGGSDLNTLLFVKQVLKRCRGELFVFVDRGTTGCLTTSISVTHVVKHGGSGLWLKPGSAFSSIE